MRLEGRRKSQNVEDRRGMGPVAKGGANICCGGLRRRLETGNPDSCDTFGR